MNELLQNEYFVTLKFLCTAYLFASYHDGLVLLNRNLHPHNCQDAGLLFLNERFLGSIINSMNGFHEK